jgi:hypothetical protein
LGSTRKFVEIYIVLFACITNKFLSLPYDTIHPEHVGLRNHLSKTAEKKILQPTCSGFLVQTIAGGRGVPTMDLAVALKMIPRVSKIYASKDSMSKQDTCLKIFHM